MSMRNPPQHPRIARQPGNGNSHMIVNPNQFLLIRRKLARRSLSFKIRQLPNSSLWSSQLMMPVWKTEGSED